MVGGNKGIGVLKSADWMREKRRVYYGWLDWQVDLSGRD